MIPHQKKVIRIEKGTVDSHSFVQDYTAGQDTGGSLPSRSDDTVPVAWADLATVFLRLPNAGGDFCQKMNIL